MTLPDIHELASASSRATGISSESIGDGSSYTGAAIDNSSNLDALLTAEVVWVYGSAPAADKSVELYLLYAVDGANYEEISPHSLIGGFSPPADTSTHRRTIIKDLPLLPFAFKIAAKNLDTGQAVTLTVNAYTHNQRTID